MIQNWFPIFALKTHDTSHPTSKAALHATTDVCLDLNEAAKKGENRKIESPAKSTNR